MIRLNNEFRVALPVEQTWQLLTDLSRVARCLPGANLDEFVDGEYRGGLATRIGPISARYHGTASFLELDEVAHRAVISARGREDKGSGAASATVTAVLTPEDGGTRVNLATDMDVSGRAAQFGRNLLAEVSTTMVAQFVRGLEAMIANGDTAPAATVRPSAPLPATPAGMPAGDGRGRANGVMPGTRADAPGALDGVTGSSTAAVAAGPPAQLDLAATVIVPLLRRYAAPLGTAVCAAAGLALLLRRRRRGPGGRRGFPAYVLVPADADQLTGPLLLRELRRTDG